MFLLFLLAFFVAVLGAFDIPKAISRPCSEPLSRDVTSFVNGFFIVLVFLRHSLNYIPEERLSGLDHLYISTVPRIGQMIVTTFLMYSGYGVMESMCSKENYADRMPLSRILPYILDMAIALIPYGVLCAVQGLPLTLDKVLLSLVGRASLGNSNWYSFAILCMWVFTWLSFKVAKRPWEGIGLVTVATIVYIVVLWMDNPVEGSRWYNTAFCYPAGMAMSLLLRRFGVPDFRKCICGIAVCIGICAFTYLVREPYALMINVRGVSFALGITLAALNVRYLSTPFVWAGKNLFYLYIYHRLMMTLLRPLTQFGAIVFIGASALLLLGWCFVVRRVHVAARSLFFKSFPAMHLEYRLPLPGIKSRSYARCFLHHWK